MKQSPFRVGDKVRAKRNIAEIKKGDEVIITCIDSLYGTWFIGWGDMEKSNWEYNCFELVVEEKKVKPVEKVEGWGF